MKLAAAAIALGPLLMLAVVSDSSAESRTCQKLDALYRANVDVTANALRSYQGCIAAVASTSCAREFWHFRSAQEGLQASFSDYFKACGSALASTMRQLQFYN